MRCREVDRPPQNLSQAIPQGGELVKIGQNVELDENIHVAVRPSVAARHGAEHAHAPHTGVVQFCPVRFNAVKEFIAGHGCFPAKV